MSYLGLHRTREARTVPFDDTTRGAMPRPGAMPEQAGRTGGPISWPRILRDAEGNQSGANGGSAGASPAAPTNPAAGATPPPPSNPPPANGAASGDSATDYPDGMGDAGKRALDAMKIARNAAELRAKAAEERAAALEAAGQTDQEKALSKARSEAESAERTRWHAHIRLSEIRSALSRAGLTDDKTLALAAGAPAFASLKVHDDGSVERIAETVDQFKKDYPAMFAAPPAPGQGGSWDGAAGGRGGDKAPDTLEGAVMDRLKKK